MNRILIPLDGSDFSRQILPTVQQLFAAGACELVLYTVGTPDHGYTGLPPRPIAANLTLEGYATEADLEQAAHPIYDSQQEDTDISALTDALDEVAAPLRGAGYSVKTAADLGKPSEAILQRAADDNIQLIAMTTHGRSGLRRLIFGSVAEEILHRAAVPVLLLRPSEA